MQASGSFIGGLLWVWPETLWTFKCHIDAFYIAFGVTNSSLNFPRTILMPFSFSLQYHASFRVKPKNVEDSFCTVLTYWAPKPTCKEGTPNRPIAFGFGSVQSGFGVWCVRNKNKKKIEKKNFFHQTETLLEDKISTKTNKKRNQHRICFQHKIQSKTRKKKHKTQTKIKQTSHRVFLETKPNRSRKKKTYFPLLSHIFSAPKQNHVYVSRTYLNKEKPISLCFPTFSQHPNTKHQANTRNIYSESRRLYFLSSFFRILERLFKEGWRLFKEGCGGEWLQLEVRGKS